MNFSIVLTSTSLLALIAMANSAAGAPSTAEVLKANEAYQAFNTFCAESFGAEREPLTYEKFGDELTVLEDSQWLHASERSAVIGWTSALPAMASVEYGPTSELGSSTDDGQERPFYTHVKYLRGLEPGQTYHYRMVGVDERGNRVASDIHTFRTGIQGNVTRIDSLPGNSAYRITRPGYYLVTADLVADHTAFLIESGDVTLDLGGHTITYNNREAAKPSGSHWDWLDQSPQGVRIAERKLTDVRIINGTLLQGQGDNGAQDGGYGANPISVMSGDSGEIAGVTAVWSGEQVIGFLLMAQEFGVHHNVLVDLGTELNNRHQGVAAIQHTRGAHHNLIKRTRHRGIVAGDNSDIYRNEIYIDSMATNAIGIFAYKGKNLVFRDNRVFGGGYLAIGIGALSAGTENVEIFDNFVHVQAAAPSGAWTEYGEQSGAYCFRVTWGGVNIQAHDNYFIAYGRDGGMVRGVWFCPTKGMSDNVIRDNVIKAVVENAESDVRGAIVISGSEEHEGVEQVLIENNRIISNFCHVLLGEPYGAGHSARFVGNTFERIGNLSRFRFVQIGFWTFPCVNNVLVDSKFVGNVNPGLVKWDGNDVPRQFDLAWTLQLEGRPGTLVTIEDATGTIAAQGEFDADGFFRAELIEARYDAGSVTRMTPHTIDVDGRKRRVVVNEPMEITW